MPRHVSPRERVHRRPDPFYLSTEWRRVRASILARDSVCVECRSEKSTAVDHIVAMRLAPDRRSDPTNLRGLCARCHNARSGKQYNTMACEVGIDGEPMDASHPWNAGEQTRVTFKGTRRTPDAWQLDAIKSAMVRAHGMGAILARQDQRPRDDDREMSVEDEASSMLSVPKRDRQ